MSLARALRATGFALLLGIAVGCGGDDDQAGGLDDAHAERQAALEGSLRTELKDEFERGTQEAEESLSEEGVPTEDQTVRVSEPNCQEGELQAPELPRGEWECDVDVSISSETGQPFEPSIIFRVTLSGGEQCWTAEQSDIASRPGEGFRNTPSGGLEAQGCL